MVTTPTKSAHSAMDCAIPGTRFEGTDGLGDVSIWFMGNAQNRLTLISKSPTSEHETGRAPVGPVEWQTSDSVEAPCTCCAARTRNTGETPPSNWQTTA